MKTAKFFLCILAVALFASCKKAPADQPGSSDDPKQGTESTDPKPGTDSEDPVVETGLKAWDDGVAAVDPAKGFKGYIPYKLDGVSHKAELASINEQEVTLDADGYVSSVEGCAFDGGKYVFDYGGTVSVTLNSKGLVETFKQTATWEDVVNTKELTFAYDENNRMVSVKTAETSSAAPINIKVDVTLVWEDGLLKELEAVGDDFSSKRTFFYGEYPNPLGIMPSCIISSMIKEGSISFTGPDNIMLQVLCLSGGFGVVTAEFPVSSSYIMEGSKTPSDTGYYIEFDETTGAIPTAENTTDFEWK